MTDATLGKCQVCHIQPAIGVASTSLPLSVAFCLECARRGADPESVFLYWFEDCFGIDFENMTSADTAVTFSDGQYVTYREWATKRAKENDYRGADRD